VDKLVWIDCEMTGLDVGSDLLLEVAVLVTDSNLVVLDEGIDLVIHADAEQLSRMDDFVTKMHATSGLTEACLASTITLEDATAQVLAYIKGHVPEARKAPLCGNSIGTDRSFLNRDMPELDAHLHYRMIDVSSIKELVRRWYPRTWFAKPDKAGGHRALADITESIKELTYYRRAVFVPEPGPDTATAGRIAAELSGGAPLS
jgi:oligoribonuclease